MFSAFLLCGRQIEDKFVDGKQINSLMPNDLWRRSALSPLKIKIPSKNKREKPTNTSIILSIY
jgi:hypothetical protein